MGLLSMLTVLSLFADTLSESNWLLTLMTMEFFSAFSEVAANGVVTELTRMEPTDVRGQIMTTCQQVKTVTRLLSLVITTFLLNGPETNSPNCVQGWLGCWSFGLNVKQYYSLLLIAQLPLFLLICTVNEPSSLVADKVSGYRSSKGLANDDDGGDDDNNMIHNSREVSYNRESEYGQKISAYERLDDLRRGIWQLLQSKATLYLIIFGKLPLYPRLICCTCLLLNINVILFLLFLVCSDWY